MTDVASKTGRPELVADDPDWPYPGDSGTARRRLRVWRIAPDAIVAVLTERRTDAGTSITTAAVDIRVQLEQQWPDDRLQVLEHYADHDPPARYSWVAMHHSGRPVWSGLPYELALEILPGLEDPA